MEKILNLGINNGAKISVITRPISDYKKMDVNDFEYLITQLINIGIKIIFKSNIYQKFAIIDSKIVWYGSINFLSYERAEESIMRLESVNIANELIVAINEF